MEAYRNLFFFFFYRKELHGEHEVVALEEELLVVDQVGVDQFT